MELNIKLTDLQDEPCSKYLDYIKRNYGDGEFDAIQVIKELDGGFNIIRWLINNCKQAETNEMIDYYISLNPEYENVKFLIIECELAQTNEMLDYYKSLNPDYKDVSWLIANCEFTQTNEMIDYFISLNPEYQNAKWFAMSCEFAKDSLKLNDYLKTLETVNSP